MNVANHMISIKRRSRRARGAVMVEYVFLLIFVAIVALASIKTFGQTVNDKMSNNNNSVTSAWQ
ncbi:MAG: Flp family type IVb pilin [Capsulimonadaceae bacterium]